MPRRSRHSFPKAAHRRVRIWGCPGCCARKRLRVHRTSPCLDQGRRGGGDEVSGARPGTKSQLNESVDSQHLGALENRIEVAIVKRMPHGRRTRTALRVSKHLTAYLTA